MIFVVATGHRPDKLGGYGPPNFDNLMDVAVAALQAEKTKTKEQICCITGMALGWDQAFCYAALGLKLPVIAALPCRGQHLKWPLVRRNEYEFLLTRVTKVVYVHDGMYTDTCMQERNEWMADRAHIVHAMWNGSPGGTANFIKYAKSMENPPKIVNLWSMYHGKSNNKWS